VTVSKYWLHSSLCISLRGFSYKSPIAFLLTELFNICWYKLASLYAPFTFFVSTTPLFHFVSKIVLETELGEALNEEIYLKSDRGTKLVNPTTSQVSPAVSESGSHISPVVNGVFARYLHATL